MHFDKGQPWQYDDYLLPRLSVYNKHQSNSAKIGIAFSFYSPGGCSNLPLHFLAGGPPSNTMCHWTPQVYLPNSMKICSTVLQTIDR